MIQYETVNIGNNQIVRITVYDSLQSLEKNRDTLVEGASVKMTVGYPTLSSECHHGSTDSDGSVQFSWDINENSVDRGEDFDHVEAQIIVKVSNRDKISSELTKTFNIRQKGFPQKLS